MEEMLAFSVLSPWNFAREWVDEVSFVSETVLLRATNELLLLVEYSTGSSETTVLILTLSEFSLALETFKKIIGSPGVFSIGPS